MTEEKNKENILVVEDEDIARKNLEHILVKTGYDVISVNNGKKAIELLQSRTIDLVITDLKMEQVDGMQVLRKTKELQPYTEVIMITGYATVDSSVEAMHQGAYYYIAKPYKIEEVRNVPFEEIQDAAGNAIPGFSQDECPEIIGDQIERVVSWKGGRDVSSLQGTPVRLRFILQDADLFALQFQQTP